MKEAHVKPRYLVLISVAFLFTAVIFLLNDSSAQGPNCPPDKELCARMIRFGKEAYKRGKYLDAKEYFRRAVQADSSAFKAWRYYDQAVIFALAEKVEKNANLVQPDVSVRREMGGKLPETAPPVSLKPAAQPKKGGVLKLKVDDDEEGC
jgi:hypothetical protein